MIDRVNEILRRHTDIASLTFARVDGAYDAKMRLRGAGLVALRMRRLSAINLADLSIYQAALFVTDVRADQHDLTNFQIADHIGDSVLWRCQSIDLVVDNDRVELR